MDPVVSQLTSIVPAARSLQELTRPLLEMLAQSTGMESTYLTSVDTAAGQQHVQFARNADPAFTIPEGLSVPWGDTLCKRAIEEECRHADDVADRWGDCEAARALGIRTYVSTPIRNTGGELLGTLCAASPARRPLSRDAEGLLRLFGNLVGQVMERERLVEQLVASNAKLAAHAMTDSLTGLPNRRALVSELKRMLAQAARNGTSVLVGLADFDGFKSINDTHGHDVGDEFLKDMAQRMSGAVRAGDLVGRLGGDEFVILGPGPQLPAEGKAGLDGVSAIVTDSGACLAAHSLQDRCARATVGSFAHGHVGFDYAGASVGVVAIDPRSVDVERALKLADAAMYQAKRQRKRLLLAA